MSSSVITMSIDLPRYAASPRNVARAGDLWRVAQEAAVRASTEVGWSPERYVQEGTGFVVYEVAARHSREVKNGETLTAHTWIRDVRRRMLSRREVRLDDAQGKRVFAATQHWVHVAANLRPLRASDAMVAAFPPVEVDDPEVILDPLAPSPPLGEHTFDFEVWHTWIDPNRHVNHPTYVDFCDEAIGRIALEAGADPQGLIPLAERVVWKSGAVGADRIAIRSHWYAAGDAVRFEQEHRLTDGTLLARATAIRRHAERGGLSWVPTPR
jgi:acyl-CoA thioesterase FadM